MRVDLWTSWSHMRVGGRSGVDQPIKINTTMMLLDCTWLCYTLPWLYLLFLTRLHSTMWLNLTLLYYTLCNGCTWLYQTLLWLYCILLYSTTRCHCSTWLYCTLPWFYLTLPSCTTLYHGSTWLYFALPHSTMTLLYSTTLYHGSAWVYYTQSYQLDIRTCTAQSCWESLIATFWCSCDYLHQARKDTS